MKFLPLVNAFDSRSKLILLRFVLGNYVAMSEREMAKVVGVSHTTVNRIMKVFYDLDLVFPRRVGNVTLWERNEDSLAFTELTKLLACINSLPSPREHLMKTIASHLDHPRVKKVVLFGSISVGRERSGSDIDLLVLTTDQVGRASVSKKIDELREVCLKNYGNSLSPIVLTENEIRKPTNKYLIENMEKGTVIIPFVRKNE